MHHRTQRPKDNQDFVAVIRNIITNLSDNTIMPPPQTQPLSTHHLRSENSSPELHILRPIHNLHASPSHDSSSGLSTSTTHVHKRHPSPLSDEDGQRKSIQSEIKDTYNIMVPLVRLFVALIVIGDDVIKGVSQVLFVLLALFEITFLSAFVL